MATALIVGISFLLILLLPYLFDPNLYSLDELGVAITMLLAISALSALIAAPIALIICFWAYKKRRYPSLLFTIGGEVAALVAIGLFAEGVGIEDLPLIGSLAIVGAIGGYVFWLFAHRELEKLNV
jgi:ammonia channel protein AmtB